MGGETITIVGNNLPSSVASILIGTKAATIVSATSTQIVIKSPKSAAGIYPLIIPVGTIGYAQYEN